MGLIVNPSNASPVIRFDCHVEGVALLSPPMSAEAVCARFKSGLEAATGTKTVTGTGTPGRERDVQGWIRVSVRFAKPGIASAELAHADGGKIKTHPKISVAVSDRPIGPDVIELLVKEVARALGTT